MPTGFTFYVGSTIFLVTGGLAILALSGLLLRALAMLVSTGGALARALPRWLWPVGQVQDPLRPFSVEGLSPALASLARQTRTLALELRRRSEVARHWPKDGERVRAGWWSFLVDGGDFTPLIDTRREVYDWLHSVDALGERDRGELTGLGIDPEQVRRTLVESMTVSRAPADGVRALAGLLWTIDERLAGATGGGGYRANGFRASEVGRTGAGAGVGGAKPVFAPVVFDGEGGEGGDRGDQDGDEARERQLAAVLAEHGPAISRMAASYGRGRSEREDLEQDIALALWRALPRFRGDATLKTFVHRVARYCCFAHLRRRRPGVELIEGSLVDTETCPESALLHEDERARVERALAGLPDTLESTISLHLRGMSYAEIARTLGISERNVSVRLTRARQQLRRELCAA